MPIVTLDDLLSGKLSHSIHGTLPKLTPTEQAHTTNYIRILPHEIKIHIFQFYIEQILDRTTSLAFHLHHPADGDRYHDAVIAGKLLAAGNKLLDGVPDAAGDVRISVQLLVRGKLREQRQTTATAGTAKRLEVELKALTQLATRCVRLLEPVVDPAEQVKQENQEPKPFGYEFNEDGTFYGGNGMVRRKNYAQDGGIWGFDQDFKTECDDFEEGDTPDGDYVSTPSTIRLDQVDESEENSAVTVHAQPEARGQNNATSYNYMIRRMADSEHKKMDAESESSGRNFDDDNTTEHHEDLHARDVDAFEEDAEVNVKKEEGARAVTAKEESWS